MKPNRWQALLFASVALLVGATVSSSGAQAANHPQWQVPPSITITSGVNCGGAITIGWSLQRFDQSTRAWTWYDGEKPRMTLQGKWHNAWYDIANEQQNSGGENHMRYVNGKAVTAFRIYDRQDNAASMSWPLEALEAC